MESYRDVSVAVMRGIRSGNGVAVALAESLDKPFPWGASTIDKRVLEIWTNASAR